MYLKEPRICWGHAVASFIEALRYKPEGRVQFPIKSLDFLIPTTQYLWDKPSFYQKSVPGIFLGVKGGRHLKLTTSPPSVNRLFIKCRSPDVSQPYGPLQPITRIVFLSFTLPHIRCVEHRKYLLTPLTRSIENDMRTLILIGCNLVSYYPL
jgi:hypothetical protein